VPKIVDHEAYRAALVEKAIPLFRDRGFHGLGMRAIAQHLGISKSALYHYFDSKQALFEACSRQVTSSSLADVTGGPPHDALLALAHHLDGTFKGELSLLIDYLRPLTADAVRLDEPLQGALTAYRDQVASIVGEPRADDALNLLLGLLLRRLLDGGRTSFTPLQRFFSDVP